MRIRQIPILRDNYAYLIVDDVAGVMAVVDPAEPGAICAALAEESARLTHILCTHHHWDHSGGNVEMKRRFPEALIVGGARDAHRIPEIGLEVTDGQSVTIGGLTAEVREVPCHTSGHVAYLFGPPPELSSSAGRARQGPALFCGDTLFVAGCGRFFEGGGAQMHRALNGVFGALPDDTRVYCGHEYTVANLRFAASVEPDNPAITAKASWARAQRAAGRSTVPSTIGEEKTYNPFMRVSEAPVQAAMGTTDPVSTMSALRAAKNAFKG